MLQLVLISTSMTREFSLSDLALIHTQECSNHNLTSPPDDDMDWLVDIVFSHHVVVFDTETQ